MKPYLFRLLPPRRTFQQDMTPAERETMTAHVAYWTRLATEGHVLAFGPVLDGDGGYGVGIILADSYGDAEALRDADPAIQSEHGMRTEIAPMPRLVTPGHTYTG